MAKALNFPAKNIWEKPGLAESIITSPLVKENKESVLLELFNKDVQLFVLVSNFTRFRGSSMKISVFVSIALLCIDGGEYELGKTVLLGQSCDTGYSRGT